MRQVEKTLGTLWEAGKELVTGITQGMTQPHCQEIRKRYLVPDQEKGDPSVYTAGPREAEDSGSFRQSKCSPICNTVPTVSRTLRPNGITAAFSEAQSTPFLSVPCPPYGHWVGKPSSTWPKSTMDAKWEDKWVRWKQMWKSKSPLGSTKQPWINILIPHVYFLKHWFPGREYWPSKEAPWETFKGKHKYFWLLLQLKNKFKKLFPVAKLLSKNYQKQALTEGSNYTKMPVAIAGNSSGASLTQAVNSTVYGAQHVGKTRQMGHYLKNSPTQSFISSLLQGHEI